MNQQRLLLGCTGVAAALAGSLGFVVAGVRGVPSGALPVRVEIAGGAVSGPVEVEEAWSTRHPGSEGWLPLWPGNERVRWAATLRRDAVEATVHTSSWCFFEQRLRAVQVGPVSLQPFGADCAVQADAGDARLELGDQVPSCIGYDPARTTSLTVRVDVTPLNLVFARSDPPIEPRDHHLPVPAGTATTFVLSGGRLGGTWPLGDLESFDARLVAVAVDPDTWDRVLGPWTGATPRRVTRERWEALFAAAATSAPGWELALERDRLRVTPPDRPGESVRIAVAGFGDGDARTQPAALALIVSPPPDAPAPRDRSGR